MSVNIEVYERDYIDLLDSSSSWRITANPEGAGLMLCVVRGIPCEQHTQVVSYHTTNTPDMRFVKAVVARHKTSIVAQIAAFVALMQSIGWGESYRGQTEHREMIALAFYRHLLKWIGEQAVEMEFPTGG